MPEVRASFADITSGFPIAPAGGYEWKVEKVELKNNDPDHHIITSVMDDPRPECAELTGVVRVFDHLTFKTKEGQPNRMALGRLKDYGVAIIGEQAGKGAAINDDDFPNGRFYGEVTIDNFTRKDGTPGQSNKFTRVLPLKRDAKTPAAGVAPTARSRR